MDFPSSNIFEFGNSKPQPEVPELKIYNFATENAKTGRNNQSVE